MPPQNRKDFLEKLGRDPTNPQAEPSDIPQGPLLYGTRITQPPAFNTSQGLDLPSALPSWYSSPFSQPAAFSTGLNPPNYSQLAPHRPAPTKGLLIPGNISNLYNSRKWLLNPDGSVSTTLSGSDKDENPRSRTFGKEVLLPTVVNGRLLSKQQAWDRYYKTGEHLGVFDNPDNADAYASWLHGEQTRQGGMPPFQ